MTEAINQAVGCHYFPPSPRLPYQSQNITALRPVPIILPECLMTEAHVSERPESLLGDEPATCPAPLVGLGLPHTPPSHATYHGQQILNDRPILCHSGETGSTPFNPLQVCVAIANCLHQGQLRKLLMNID